MSDTTRRASSKWLVISFAIAIAVVFVTEPEPTAAATGDPVLLNEVLASHSGFDDAEYIELFGTAGTSLSGLSVIVVEGDSFGPGRIDRRYDFKPFHALGANGFFLIGNCSGLPADFGVTPDASIGSNYLENSSLTLALVETSSLGGGLGSFVTGGEVVRDSVALNDGGAGDTFFFGAPVIGPAGPFFPAGARRVVDGVDTDTAADWAISDFGLPGANTPTGGGFDGCAPVVLTIPEIQGSGQFSFFEGDIVETTGVVTLITSNGRDMWVQDTDGDGDPATSDGIFVDDRDRLSPRPNVGDIVTIRGQVEEQQFGNALPRTRIDDTVLVSTVSTGNALPAPVPLVGVPDFSIDAGTEFWEALEGMLVSVEDATVVAATSRFGEFGMLAPDSAVPGSGFFAKVNQILLRGLGGNVVDYNPERILVDDAALDTPELIPGDAVGRAVGVVDYTFGNYKLQLGEMSFTAQPLPAFPVSTRNSDQDSDSDSDDGVAITSYNVENLFDLLNNPDKNDGGSTPTPSQLETKLAKLALSIEHELRLPAIMVLQEVENTAITQQLGDRVNASAGTSYLATSFETSDARGIEVAFLWDTARVTLLDAFQLSGFDIEAAFGPSSASPGREPLYGMFRVGGEVVHIVGNHFKSKGGDDPIYGLSFNRVTEVQRKMQAQAVRNFVDTLFAQDDDSLVLVTGDLNDFQFGEPMRARIIRWRFSKESEVESR